MQAVTEFGFGCILPLLVLLLHLYRRTKPGRGKLSAWMVGISGIFAALIVWLAVNITHTDCGNDCVSYVVPYGTNDAVATTLVVLWVAIMVICVRKVKHR